MPQDKSAKKSAITPLSIRVGDLLTSAYNGARMPDGRRMKQEDLSSIAGIPLPTLQKKLAGKAPITTTDLVLIAGAIPYASAGTILETAVTQMGGYETLLSVARGNNVIAFPNTETDYDEYQGAKVATEIDDEAIAPPE